MLQSQALAEQANRWMDHLTFATTLRDAIGGATVIKALFATAEKEWNNCFDANDPDTHLIKGVFTSNQKSDAVRVYVSKLVAQYMKSIGMRLTSWTKGTIASENFTNVAITNRIAATQFVTNYELFKIVVTRLIGLDDGLVDFALCDHPKGKARELVAYLGLRFDLGETREEVIAKYPDAVMYFEDLLDEETATSDEHWKAMTGKVDQSAAAFSPDWFEQLLLNIANYPHQDVKFDFFDMLAVFEKHHYSFIADPHDTNIPATLTVLLNKGYETVTCKLPDGRNVIVKAGDGEVTMLPTREERMARLALEQLYGYEPGQNIDCVAMLAEARELFKAGAKAKQFHAEDESTAVNGVYPDGRLTIDGIKAVLARGGVLDFSGVGVRENTEVEPNFGIYEPLKRVRLNLKDVLGKDMTLTDEAKQEAQELARTFSIPKAPGEAPHKKISLTDLAGVEPLHQPDEQKPE